MATQECSFSLNPLEGFRHCVDVPEESNSVYIGISLAILASCMNCLGINLQKVGSRRGSAMITTLGLVLASATGIVDMASQIGPPPPQPGTVGVGAGGVAAQRRTERRVSDDQIERRRQHVPHLVGEEVPDHHLFRARRHPGPQAEGCDGGRDRQRIDIDRPHGVHGPVGRRQ